MHRHANNTTTSLLDQSTAFTWIIMTVVIILLILIFCNRTVLGQDCFYATTYVFSGLVGHVIDLLDDVLKMLIVAYKHLPWTWYLLTALTLFPVCLNTSPSMPGDPLSLFASKGTTIFFFAVYCITALLMCLGLPDPYGDRLRQQRLHKESTATKLRSSVTSEKDGIFARTRITI